MKKLEDKVVLITGGNSGIGKASAIAAAREGARIVVADLETQPHQETLREIEFAGGEAVFIACDVSDPQQIGEAVRQTVDQWGRLDVAFNNAGVSGELKPIAEMSDEAYNLVININLNGVFYCMKYELQQMIKQGKGVIVNMSSILGQVGSAYSCAYVAAKHGVIGLTQTAALEYAAQNIRINALCPGYIETPLLSKAGIEENQEMKHVLIEKHPMKRLGKPEEVANAFIWLASDDSGFCNGSAFAIDGGYLAE